METLPSTKSNGVMALYFWCDEFENDVFESKRYSYTSHFQTHHFQNSANVVQFVVFANCSMSKMICFDRNFAAR